MANKTKKTFYSYKMNKFLKRKRDEVESLEKPRRVVVRKYDPEYIKYGFISAGTRLELTAQRVECAQILSNIKASTAPPFKTPRSCKKTKRIL